jgi:4-hydroxybenzoate polyprenyltransferase
MHAAFSERCRAVLHLGRPRTCAPGTMAYALGFSYTGAEPGTSFALGAALSFLVSFAANLHNALSDTREDSYNLPGRTALIGDIGTRALKRLLVVLSVVMLAGAWTISPWFLLAMVGALLGLHQYSFGPLRAKANPVFGLIVFAQAVGFPFIFGLGTAPDAPVQAFNEAFVRPVLEGRLPEIWYALEQNRYAGMFLFIVAWFIAKGFFKNVPDYDGDRAAGLSTSATIFATREYAAATAKWITLAAYLSLAGLVLLRLEQSHVLWSLVWFPVVWWNANRLMQAQDRVSANAVLKRDMIISSAFLATLLMLASPMWYNAALIGVALTILWFCDYLAVDSRRSSDIAGPTSA